MPHAVIHPVTKLLANRYLYQDYVGIYPNNNPRVFFPIQDDKDQYQDSKLLHVVCLVAYKDVAVRINWSHKDVPPDPLSQKDKFPPSLLIAMFSLCQMDLELIKHHHFLVQYLSY